MDFTEYIKPELAILIPVMHFLGLGLKTNGLPGRWFPLVLGLVSIALSRLYIFSTCDCEGYQAWLMAAFGAVAQGVLIAGASIYANNLHSKTYPPDEE